MEYVASANTTSKPSVYRLGGKDIFDELHRIFVLFIIGSMLGWIYETINDYVSGRGIMLRASLLGPWAPIYGIGVVLIVVLFGRIAAERRFGKMTLPIVSLLIVILVDSVELIGSYVCEWGMGTVPWDYSDYFLNYDGRIALKSTLVFLIGGLVCLYGIWPHIKAKLDAGDGEWRTVINVLAILFVIDLVFEATGMNTEIKQQIINFGNGAITIQGDSITVQPPMR